MMIWGMFLCIAMFCGQATKAFFEGEAPVAFCKHHTTRKPSDVPAGEGY